MSPIWRIELFGKFHAQSQQQSISRFRTRKTGALLAYLAFYLERSHPREALIELLWPEAEPSSGRHNLRLALSSLRRQLEPPEIPEGSVVFATTSAIQLNLAAVATDVADFECLLERAAQVRYPSDKIMLLSRTAALYQGNLLPGYYESWIPPQQLRLEDAYTRTMLELLRLLEEAGDLTQAIRYSLQAITLAPEREELHLALMRLYAAANQPAKALQQYRQLERRLQEHGGEGPSSPTRQLARILREGLSEARLPNTSPALSIPVLSPSPSDLTVGTMTFLVTGLDEASQIAERDDEAIRYDWTTAHDLVCPLISQHGGRELNVTENGLWAAFPRADTALACAIAAQKAFHRQVCPEAVAAVRMRAALHTGDVAIAPEGDQKDIIRHTGQILAAARGGQILCSETTAALLARSLTLGTHLTSLGAFRLPGWSGIERLFQVTYPEMPARRFPPVKAPLAYTGCLPPQATRFVGRQAELACLLQRVLSDRARLITLTGPGGTGKTRMALEAAARLEEEFQGAVWFVPLADLSEASVLLSEIRQALGVSESPEDDDLEQVAAVLSESPALLVLDNFEHLVEQGAFIVGRLLERVPALTCLITSRQRLALADEREFEVSPLLTPELSDPPEQLVHVESVQLFVDRAQAVRPDFQVTRSNARAVAELCARLEGIPLALELAAARIQVMSPAQMLAQLEHRFDFLVGRRRDAVDRHRTLRAAIDWSYRQLPSELERFFARLSVFRGGWTLEAADIICHFMDESGRACPERSEGMKDEQNSRSDSTLMLPPSSLDLLEQLQERSLIRAEESGTEMRFRMLETLREYTSEQLTPQEQAIAQKNHAEYYLEWAERVEPELRRADQLTWLDRIEREHDNLQVALQWSLQSGATELGLRLAGALERFWLIRGFWAKGREILAELLAFSSTTQSAAEASAGSDFPLAVHAKAVKTAALLALEQTDYDAASALADRGLCLYRELRDDDGAAECLGLLGRVAKDRNEIDRARELHEESLRLRRKTGRRQGIADALTNLGFVLNTRGDSARVFSLHQEALGIYRELGDRRQIAGSLLHLAAALVKKRKDASVHDLYLESLGIYRELRDKRGMALCLSNLGSSHLIKGDTKTARRMLRESLVLWRELGHKIGIASALRWLAAVEEQEGDVPGALRHYTEALLLYVEVKNLIAISEILSKVVALEGNIGEEKWAAQFIGTAKALREHIDMCIATRLQLEEDLLLAQLRQIFGAVGFT